MNAKTQHTDIYSRTQVIYATLLLLFWLHVIKKPQPYKLKTIQPQLINATLKATGQNYIFHPNNL